MRIAVIDKKDIELKIDNNAIKVNEQTIPFKIIDLVILNHRIKLNTSDILKLTKNEISILIVSHNNTNISIISSANAKNADIKEKQFLSLNRRLEFSKIFIIEKFKKHKLQLANNDINIEIDEEIISINKALCINEIMGIEGSFARKYFKYYFELLPLDMHKSKRSKRPPNDPVNAVMSYWYSLYYNIITVKLLSFGFDPSIGYLHTAFRSHNALSSDFIEMFRADINSAVIPLFKNEILSNEDFTNKNGVYLKYDGRKKIWPEFIALNNSLKAKLDFEIANLKARIFEKNINN